MPRFERGVARLTRSLRGGSDARASRRGVARVARLVLAIGVVEGVGVWGRVSALKPKRFQWHLWDVRGVVGSGVERRRD